MPLSFTWLWSIRHQVRLGFQSNIKFQNKLFYPPRFRREVEISLSLTLGQFRRFQFRMAENDWFKLMRKELLPCFLTSGFSSNLPHRFVCHDEGNSTNDDSIYYTTARIWHSNRRIYFFWSTPWNGYREAGWRLTPLCSHQSTSCIVAVRTLGIAMSTGNKKVYLL